MTFQDLFEEDSRPTHLEVDKMPKDESLRRIAVQAKRLQTVDARLKRAAKLMEAMSARREEIATKILPALMIEAGNDSIGLPEFGCDVQLLTRYHANIPVDWSDEKRQAGYDHLELLGGGNLVKATVQIEFEKEQLAIAKKLSEAVKVWLKKAKVDDSVTPVLDMRANWQNLKSWFTEEREKEKSRDPHAPPSNLPPVDPQLIGGKEWQECKIVPRKAEKRSKRK